MKEIFNGVVTNEVINKGSKSEHSAVLLKTANGSFQVRVGDENPFENTYLRGLVGKQITVEGVLREDVSTVFVASKADIKIAP